ncbi:MAG: hypothetical protein DRI24_11570 [Deltaproteobacteria bacterium]|nr:MAG: hypothetical protein DRI24_11570 [Deltaproteobacteria bacterium]
MAFNDILNALSQYGGLGETRSSIGDDLSGPITREGAADYAKGLGAGIAGAPGDAAGLVNALMQMKRGVPVQAADFESDYGTNAIGETMGADVDSPQFIGGTFGMPGLEDAGRAMMLGIPRLVKGMKGTSQLADQLGGVAKARKVLDDYEKDVDFIQADTIDYSIDKRLGKRMKSGKYRGAPENVKSPQKLGKMRKELSRLLEVGAPGRLWYDESTQAASELTGAQRNKKHLFAGTNAITSRGASVPANQVFGVKGYNQAITGNPAKAGRFPNAQGEAVDELASGRTYHGGPKETPFYEGLTIDERAGGVRPTNDLWMARAFDYQRKNPKTGEMELWGEGLGQAQHRFMDNEINALVDVANKAGIGGVSDWTPERVQAAIWVAKKAELEGTTVGKASTNFSNNMEGLTSTIRYEANPSTSIDHMSSRSTDDGYAGLVNSMLQDDAGRDRLALQAGALTRPSETGAGIYEGTVSPSTGIKVLAAPQTGKAQIDPASESLVNAIGATRGMTLGQDTVGTTFQRASKAGDPRNIARVQMEGGIPDGEGMRKLESSLAEQFGADSGVFPVHSEDGVQILNESGMPDKEFQAGVKRALKGTGAGKPEWGTNSGSLLGNTNWDDPGFKPSTYMKNIDEADLGDDAIKRLEAGAMDEASTLNKMDAALEAEYPDEGKRSELLTRTREILSSGGYQGIRDAVEKGILPAIVLSVIAGSIGSQASQEQSYGPA